MKPTCSVDGCKNLTKSRDLCNVHDQRMRRNGHTGLQSRPVKRCKVHGCDRKYRCSGYCGMHYKRVREYGYEGPPERIQRKPQECEIDGCDKRAKYKGLCPMHKARARRDAEVASNRSSRIQAWATNDDRLRRVGWTERLVVSELGPCWEWDGLRDRRNYGRVAVQGRKMRAAHRVAFQTWVGPIDTDQDACHKCDNPPCIRPDDLFAGSHLENMQDSVAKMRHAYGERAGQAKLTEAQVREIRARHVPRKVSYATLGVEYGVSAGAIQAIIIGRNWKHVD